tara:strand:- start:116 stop:571 length:456 start_codon:yes stop_codon:yes gene_type:complete
MGEFTENLRRCPQLMIYLVISIMSVGASFFLTSSYFVTDATGGVTLSMNLFMHVFQIFLVSSIFYYLCRYGYTTAGWVLLLFPGIIGLALAFVAMSGAILAGSIRVEAPKVALVSPVVKEEKTVVAVVDEPAKEEAFGGFDGKFGGALAPF